MFTLQEIHDQYNALKQTIAEVEKEKNAIKALFPARAVVFIGCGSSYMLSCTMRSIAGAMLTVPVYALPAGDLLLNSSLYTAMLKDALLVSVSRSGKTSEVVKAYELVKSLDLGTRFVSVVCADGTPVEALSDYTLRLPWTFDESVCQTRCVSNLFAAGAMMIGIWAENDTVMADFVKMAASGDEYMARVEPLCKELAKVEWDRAVVLADGLIDGMATEGSLAFNEISQLPSNCYHLLDCRHGPMVLFGRKTLVLAAVHSPELPYETDLIGDCLAKGCTVVRYSAGALAPQGDSKAVTFGVDAGPIASGLGLLNLCQLITYYKSFEVGCNPDLPDGLDAWIEIK